MTWPHLFHEALTGARPADPAVSRAERPLRVLLAASIVLPILIFAAVAYLAYERHFAEARARLDRSLDQIYEHALKVFETFELTARYTDELFAEVSDDQLKTLQAGYNARLKAVTATLPQLRDIWVIDRNGRPLVSGTIYPMPDVDLSDREYFVVQKNNSVAGNFISETIQSRAADRRVFLISRRRSIAATGAFNGVITTAISPEYFIEYYNKLAIGENGLASLVREDGAILARVPDLGSRAERLAADSPLYRAMRSGAQSGDLRGRTPFEDLDRIVVYRRLPRHNVYVIAGTDTNTIVREWAMQIAGDLAFGVPATLLMILLTWIALQRTRREALAHVQLQDEVQRREKTELALRQSQKMEAVGRLTGGIAHDFNNLLTAILGNIDLTLRRFKGTDERLVRSLSSAKEASRRAASLVERLLAFSRQHPQEVKVVDVNRIVRGMSELLQRTIGETVTIETVLAGGLWKTGIDPNQLENAILNLAVNARDAMPNGGRLTIETANSHLDEHYAAGAGDGLKAGQYVLVAVSDTGAGMSKETMESAFEPFFTTKPSGVGTGLGLSMVYGFVRQSGGHVRLYSEPDEGTSVKMYFPRANAEKETLDPPALRTVGDKSLPASRGSETILLVEDDVAVNQFSSEVLAELGYRVLSAHSGRDALALLSQERDVRLLFTDVVLPGGMNGRELAEIVRRERPELKVLFATGYTRNAIVHHGRLDPDVEVLLKPYTIDGMALKIRAILDEQDTAA